MPKRAGNKRGLGVAKDWPARYPGGDMEPPPSPQAPAALPRIALVTGASRGIGRACAVALSNSGLDVALHYCAHGTEAEAVAGELNGRRADGLPRRALPFRADLSQPGAAAALVEEVAARLGPPTVLVHAAGAIVEKPIAFTSVAEWGRLLELHTLSAFALAQALARHLRHSDGGRVVFIGSLAGEAGLGNGVAYAATKGALTGLARSLALEFARWKTTVNVVAPGYVETDLTAHHDQARRQAVADLVPLGRYGRAEEIAAAVVFLCSPACGYLTGQVLMLDGGLGFV
jgi:NAD(P)-dependent dehydrogenase (short-subunit alcohol dehydrogenase family)